MDYEGELNLTVLNFILNGAECGAAGVSASPDCDGSSILLSRLSDFLQAFTKKTTGPVKIRWF